MSLNGVISNGAHSRVATDGEGNKWEAGDAIGVSTMGNGTDYTNHKYATLSGNGNFTTEAGDIYLLSKNEISLTAYYPYKEADELNSGLYEFSIRNQESTYVPHDFMFAQAKVTREKDAEFQNVNLAFDHKMNRLRLTLIDHEAEEVEYTLQDVITDGTFNTATGEIVNAATASNVKIAGVGAATYLIYPPQGTKDVALNIKLGEDYYAGILPTLASSTATTGVTLNYNITLKEKQVLITLNGITVNGWGNEEGGDIEAGEKENTTQGSANGGTWGGGSHIDMYEN